VRCAGRHLVEQRLEEVEVAAVHERDAHPGVTTKHARRVETAEAAADDQDAVGHRVTGALMRWRWTLISTSAGA
jgi:hypothetical protein